MLPDDDKRYAIETCRSSESVLKKWFKNKWHTISAFVGCVMISECQYEFKIIHKGTRNTNRQMQIQIHFVFHKKITIYSDSKYKN